MKLKIKICPDCQTSVISHWQNWLEELMDIFLLTKWLPNWLLKKLEKHLHKQISIFFLSTKLAKLENNFSLDNISARTTVFIREARQRGIKIINIKSIFGNTTHFLGQIGKKKFFFASLPRVGWLDKYSSSIIDDKAKVKKILQRHHFPVPAGRSWWWWQKQLARCWAIKHLGYPLVVKPRRGSYSRHITTNINCSADLKKAINWAISYAPTFLIERYLANTFVYRITIVDFKIVACAKRLRANIISDGQHSISELIDIKNSNPYRNEAQEEDAVLFKIKIDDIAKKLLQQQNVQMTTILPKDKIIWLQNDPFVRSGADVIDMTKDVHPDNRQLFKDIAKLFGIHLVGIDVLMEDVTISWKQQPTAILELNSLPCIEIHHFPSSGQPQNVAGAIVDMVLKYYK